MAVSVADSSVTLASVKGAPLIAANEEFLNYNIDLSVLVAPNSDMERVRQEYERLEKECANFQPSEILLKASHSFVNRQNMEKGALYTRIAMSKFSSDLPDSEKLNSAIAYLNLGYYLIFERNNPIQAYPLLIKGLEICNSIEFKDKKLHTVRVNAIAGGFTNIAKIFSTYRDARRALHYYRQAYRIAREDDNPIALPMTFTDLLHYAWTSDSLSSINSELQDFNAITVPNSAYRYMHDYAKMMAKAAIICSRHGYDEALSLVDSASSAYDPYVDDRRYIVMNRIIAGKVCMEKKDYTKASDFFNEAEKMIREGKLEDLYDILFRTQAQFHNVTGNKGLAEQYRNEGLLVRDSLQQMQSYGVIRNMELSMQAKDYNEKLSDSQKETQRWIITTICAAALILIICILVVRILIKTRRLKEQSESLFRKNLELMTLVAPKSGQAEAEETNAEEEAAEPLTAIEDTPEPEEDAAETYRRVLEYMSSSPDVYTPAFTVETLADALGQKLKPVSQAINSIGGKNFNTLLAEFRIKKACERMLESPDDPALRPTIEALAEEVGYKSRTSFMRVFKSVTGMTTTEFLRQATAN